jgi:hypothetical protein
VRAWCKERIDACRAAVDATQTPAQLAEAALAVIGPTGSQGMG